MLEWCNALKEETVRYSGNSGRFRIWQTLDSCLCYLWESCPGQPISALFSSFFKGESNHHIVRFLWEISVIISVNSTL